MHLFFFLFFFFFNDTATTEIYTLSLHDALPISCPSISSPECTALNPWPSWKYWDRRSKEHTSELQSHHDLVCRLLHEKKKIRPPLGEDGAEVMRGAGQGDQLQGR